MQPFSIRDSVLTISANPADPRAVRPFLKNAAYTSGCITSELTFCRTYGYYEMRARLPRGKGFWPAFWLLPKRVAWPPEIDIFEFFNWQGRNQTRVMTGNVQSSGKPEKFGHPHDLWTKFVKGEYTPGVDFSADFHVFALDWRKDEPIWLLDGVPIKQTHYEWRGPPAHLLITNQIGMTFPGANLTGMKTDESQWNYVIDYIRIWQRPNGPPPPDDPHRD